MLVDALNFSTNYTNQNFFFGILAINIGKLMFPFKKSKMSFSEKIKFKATKSLS